LVVWAWGDGVLSLRIIPYLSCKSDQLVKGIQLEGLRKLGDPAVFAKDYYEQGADEVLYVDIVASLYGRPPMESVIRKLAAQIYVPLTVGGGIRYLADVRAMFFAGADKVCLNTAAIARPELITEIANCFGSQACMVGIEYMQGKCMTNAGREHTGLDAWDWARRAVDLGAGELLLTSISRDGTRGGFDLDFLTKVASLPVPVIAHGGAGTVEHIVEAAGTGVSGIALGSVLHYKNLNIPSIKVALQRAGEAVRA
jgi:imidazole glycerol-phosphate synthase subunit HisF